MWDVKPPVEDDRGGSWDGFDVEKLKVFEVVNPRPGEYCSIKLSVAARSE